MIELVCGQLFRIRHLRLQLLGLPQRSFVFLLPAVLDEVHLFKLTLLLMALRFDSVA